MDISAAEVQRIINKQRRESDMAASIGRSIGVDFGSAIRERDVISFILSEYLGVKNGNSDDIKL